MKNAVAKRLKRHNSFQESAYFHIRICSNISGPPIGSDHFLLVVIISILISISLTMKLNFQAMVRKKHQWFNRIQNNPVRLRLATGFLKCPRQFKQIVN